MNQEDTAWKKILDYFLEDFFALCLPDFYGEINWERGWESLDTELNAISKSGLIGKRVADKIVKIYLKSGIAQLVIIHIEVQASGEKSFPKRMFFYHTRLMDRYDLPIFSCAILTDANLNWRPSHYEVGVKGSKIRMDFVTIKLIDYQAQREILEASRNPFASVILAQLAAIEVKKKLPEERSDMKFILTRQLYLKGFSRQQVIDLYVFLDWLIHLPKELEYAYHKRVLRFEEDMKMPYISTAERIGMEKGLEQGMQEGQSRLLMEFLSSRFGSIPGQYREKLTKANEKQLLQWMQKILIRQVSSLEEVFD